MKALVEIPTINSWQQEIICRRYKQECAMCPLGRFTTNGYRCLWKKKSKGRVLLDVCLKGENYKEKKK